MLQLDPGTEFDILMPDLNNMLITDITFILTVFMPLPQILPRLKEIEFELNAAKKQIAAARGYIAPRLSAGDRFLQDIIML